MTQEIIALAIFIAALLYTVVTLVIYLTSAKNKPVNSCGGSSCSCPDSHPKNILKGAKSIDVNLRS
jgi:hypothetical protein